MPKALQLSAEAEFDESMQDVARKLRQLRQDERGGDEPSPSDEVLTPLLIELFCRVADHKLKQRRPPGAVRRPVDGQGENPPCPEREPKAPECSQVQTDAASRSRDPMALSPEESLLLERMADDDLRILEERRQSGSPVGMPRSKQAKSAS